MRGLEGEGFEGDVVGGCGGWRVRGLESEEVGR